MGSAGGVASFALGGGGEISSFGGWRLEMSSPSSARSAIIFPTAMFLVPAGVYSVW
jgi:hypothetical protein